MPYETIYSNRINIQINDTARLVFQDERPSVYGEPGMPPRIVSEVVLSLPTARALRDLLVEHVKDEVPSVEQIKSALGAQ